MSTSKTNENEYECSVCGGHGEVDTGNMFTCIIEKCGNCDGKGTVDWVRYIRPLKYNASRMEWQ